MEMMEGRRNEERDWERRGWRARRRGSDEMKFLLNNSPVKLK